MATSCDQGVLRILWPPIGHLVLREYEILILWLILLHRLGLLINRCLTFVKVVEGIEFIILVNQLVNGLLGWKVVGGFWVGLGEL